MASAGTSNYTTNELAKSAANVLAGAVNAPQEKYNDLNSYVANDMSLRQDYIPYMDYASVLGKYNTASDAAWDLAKAEQIKAMNAAEDQNYGNTKASVSEMRKSLAGSASAGATRGAANATALQAILGLGSTNATATTAAMQGYQNAAKEAANTRAANAVNALNFNKTALDSMYSNATAAYTADRDALGQAAYGSGQGLGTVGGAIDSNASAERMNNATNQTNASVANTNTKQTIYNKK